MKVGPLLNSKGPTFNLCCCCPFQGSCHVLVTPIPLSLPFLHIFLQSPSLTSLRVATLSLFSLHPLHSCFLSNIDTSSSFESMHLYKLVRLHQEIVIYYFNNNKISVPPSFQKFDIISTYLHMFYKNLK